MSQKRPWAAAPGRFRRERAPEREERSSTTGLIPRAAASTTGLIPRAAALEGDPPLAFAVPRKPRHPPDLRTAFEYFMNQPRSVLTLLPTPCRVALLALVLSGCATMGLRSAVSMKVEREKGTPKDALVYIDEQYVGTLEFVEKRGVRLPEGEHRISVEKNGYYPYDTLVISDRDALQVKVTLLKLPE